jgi:hypothetical protein
MDIDRNNLRSDPWGSGLILVAVLFVVFASAALVMYTRRIEFAILGGTPVALLLLSNYRLATMVTVWVVLIWMLRWPFMFFEVLQFSYVVYASVALTIGAYLLRLATPGRRHLPLTGNGWLWLLVGTVIAGGVHGASNVGSIPPWLLSGPDADLGVPWIYYRTVVLPGVLLPLIAILVGASICDKEKPTALLTPVWTLVCATAALIVGEILLSGEALSVIATQRSEHLTILGFHSNEFGTFLAIAYGLSLGVWNSAESGREKKKLGVIVVGTGIALLLTFSRGAYLAFAVTNVVVFMGSSPKKRAAFLLVTLLLALAAPAPLVERAGYGLTTRGQVVDGDAHGAHEQALLRILAQVQRRQHAHRDHHQAHHEDHHHGPEDGREDAALGVRLARLAAHELPDARGVDHAPTEPGKLVGGIRAVHVERLQLFLLALGRAQRHVSRGRLLEQRR